MTDFIREVNEEVRQDRVRRVLERFWPVIAAAVVAVLVAVGGWKWAEADTARKAEAASNQYLDALDLVRDGKADEAVSALKAVEASGTPGYRLLARFRLAGETGSKDPKAGAGMFDALAADPSVDPSLQEVARLRAALLLVDLLPYPELKTRLAPLADANNPLRNPAREMLALAALKADQPAEAGVLLDQIEADSTVSGSLRQRAEALSGLVRGAGAVPTAPKPTP